jgi:two-component system chemotaxis response regulator CheB
MSTDRKTLILEVGKGAATRNPAHLIRAKITTGLALLLFDQAGESGGLIHLLEGSSDTTRRILGLQEKIRAKKIGAKIVGCEAAELANQVRAALATVRIPIIAESVEGTGLVEVIATPAKGLIRFKRTQTAVVQAAKLSQASTQGKVKVLIVDDAPVIRKLLTQIISQDAEFVIVGQAASAAEADTLLKTLTPDVITLDIHMPVEDGVSFLGRLMARRFIPVVLVTSASMSESEKVFEALSLGAIDYIQKPAFDELEEVGSLIRDKLKVASRVKDRRRTGSKLLKDASSSKQPIFSAKPRAKSKALQATKYSTDSEALRLVAIGASTGGVQALTEILTRLPENIPPIVIVQHIPPIFSRAFCERLDRICPFHVKEASDGDVILPGQVLLAPGGLHMKVVQKAGHLAVNVFKGERVNRHMPSVEVLFQSVASVVGARALGIMLTGMGDDGAVGLLEMKNRGASTIAQDEASCVVFGMPGASVKIGAAGQVLSLQEITRSLSRLSVYKLAS